MDTSRDRLKRIQAVIKHIEEIRGDIDDTPVYTRFFSTVDECSKEEWWYTVIANKFQEIMDSLPEGSLLMSYSVNVSTNDNTDIITISAGDPSGLTKDSWFGYNSETSCDALSEQFNQYNMATINIMAVNSGTAFSRVINMEWTNKDEQDTEPTVQNTEVQ